MRSWIEKAFYIVLIVTVLQHKHLKYFISTNVVVDALPLGFVDEGIANINSPSKAIFVPNPRTNGATSLMIVVTKDGEFYGIENPDTLPKKFEMGNMNAKLCTNGPRGVYNIVAHPDFIQNRHVYVYYTNITKTCAADPIIGPVNRLSRFTIQKDTLQILLNTEVVLLETPPSPVLLHDGGGMFIGNDQLLYLAIGDGGSLPYGQDMRVLYGKLIRLSLAGNVPRDNPYTAFSGGRGVNCRSNKGSPPITAPANAVCEEIYSTGLRNPFRASVDPNTVSKVRFAIGDVGNAAWEEISYGGTDYKGTNYGFSIYEGICVLNSKTDCPIQPPGFTEPFYYYQHTEAGGAVTGVVFVPNNIGWPEQYQFLFIEYVAGRIYNLIPDATVGCRTCKPPRPNYRNETFHNYERIVDIFFAPYRMSNGTLTQAMYYLSRGGGDNIRRIRYVGGNNRAPNAIITLSKKQYALNEAVSFIGSNSTDPDVGDVLTYAWTFGDGRTSTQVNPTRSYAQLGTYSIELTVTDKAGVSTKAFETIVVGTPPTVNFDSPISGLQFSVGDVIRLRGRGRNSTGAMLPSSQLFWEVRLRHASHFHPYLSYQSGNDFDLFPAPPPEDFMAATNSYLQFILTAVDSFNVSRTRQRNVYPRKVLLDINTKPSGLIVVISDFNVRTPATITAWQNQSLKISVFDQGIYQFDKWNIGGPRDRLFVVPPQGTINQKITAEFVPVE